MKEQTELMTAEQIQANYELMRDTPSDINQHLPVLLEYYNKCEHITEFGTRSCVSLYAALASNAKKVVAYDIADVNVPNVEKLTFICANDLEVEIGETDFLFIDTKHDYEQLKAELACHSGKVKKWIGLHDTFFYARRGESSSKGLLDAIEEFLRENLNWTLCYHSDDNNGLTIISFKL